MNRNFHPGTLLALLTLAAVPSLAQQTATPAAPVASQPPARFITQRAQAPSSQALRPCQAVTVDPPTYLTLGKSQVIRLESPAVRMLVGGMGASPVGRAAAAASAPAAGSRAAPAGGPSGGIGVADTEITLLSPTELFFLGRKTGSMNVVLQSADGRCVVKDIVVTIDPTTLQANIAQLLPGETGVKVQAAEDAIVLSGTVTDSIKLERVLTLAGAYGDGKKVVNFLSVGSPQQVMLEVKIAEVSKTLLNRLGLDFSRLASGSSASSVISGILGGGAGLFARFGHQVLTGIGGGAGSNVGAGNTTGNAFIGGIDRTQTRNPDGTFSERWQIQPQTISRNATLLGVDATKQDGIVRVLAEPNIMAISGQAASFLSGGRIFIPVTQTGQSGSAVVTLEEKEFGVGLRFTPTVLDGSRVNLKLISEVSDLSQTGSAFTAANGITTVLPSMTTRRVDTTVQLQDGQSFVVAGLIKNNLVGSLDKFPGLGEAPVLGALFRSTEFQTDQTELMFVITPRLVKPMTGPIALPTDGHIAPTVGDVLIRGKAEGSGPAPTPAP